MSNGCWRRCSGLRIKPISACRKLQFTKVEPTLLLPGVQNIGAGRGLHGLAANNESGRSRSGARHEVSHVANGDMVTLTLIRVCVIRS
jgi:hypothetical protein